MFAIQCSKPQRINTDTQRKTITTLAKSGNSFLLKDSTAENIKIPQKKLIIKRFKHESVIFTQQRSNAFPDTISEILEKRTRLPEIHVPAKLPIQIITSSRRQRKVSFRVTIYPTAPVNSFNWKQSIASNPNENKNAPVILFSTDKNTVPAMPIKIPATTDSKKIFNLFIQNFPTPRTYKYILLFSGSNSKSIIVLGFTSNTY